MALQPAICWGKQKPAVRLLPNLGGGGTYIYLNALAEVFRSEGKRFKFCVAFTFWHSISLYNCSIRGGKGCSSCFWEQSGLEMQFNSPGKTSSMPVFSFIVSIPVSSSCFVWSTDFMSKGIVYQSKQLFFFHFHSSKWKETTAVGSFCAQFLLVVWVWQMNLELGVICPDYTLRGVSHRPLRLGNWSCAQHSQWSVNHSCATVSILFKEIHCPVATK